MADSLMLPAAFCFGCARYPRLAQTLEAMFDRLSSETSMKVGQLAEAHCQLCQLVWWWNASACWVGLSSGTCVKLNSHKMPGLCRTTYVPVVPS